MSRNPIIPYRKDLKEKARYLRNNSTLSEVLLWCEIKNRQIKGFQFHRQVPMLDYIVDFYCHELKLVIEVDGSSHHQDGAPERDQFRQSRIEEYGVHFLRFEDIAVKKNLPQVLNTLIDWIIEHKPPE